MSKSKVNFKRVNLSLHRQTLRELDRQAKLSRKTRSGYVADIVESKTTVPAG